MCKLYRAFMILKYFGYLQFIVWVKGVYSIYVLVDCTQHTMISAKLNITKQ